MLHAQVDFFKGTEAVELSFKYLWLKSVIASPRVAWDEAIYCIAKAEIAGGTVPRGKRDCRSSLIDRLEACPTDYS